MSRLINRPCSLIYRFVLDEEAEFGEVSYEETWVDGVCEVQFLSGTEGPTGAPASSSWTGFFLPGVDLDAVDAVSVPGLGTFEIVGPPADRTRAPWGGGGVEHVEAQLAKTGPATEEGS